jgi:iron complex outermembrane receptor protein
MRLQLPLSWLLLAFFLFGSYEIPAQTAYPGSAPSGRLSGRLSDPRNAPVAYATVTLLRTDGSVVNGSLSQENGSFSISSVPAGTFRLRISALGYMEKLIEDITLAENTSRDLGRILLQPSSYTLENVEIVGERPVMELSVDKKTFNVDKNITTAGGSASDVLQNVPSVSVDQDGNLSLRGKSNVTLLIDGKPATLLGSDAATALQSLPASAVQSVEVITNPSAKYDAQGMGGIINIVTKKDRQFGLNGSAGIGAGTRDKYNANLNLNLRNEKWNFFLNSNFRLNRNYTYVTTKRELPFYDAESAYDDTLFRSYEDNKRKFLSWFTTGGAEYTIDERNTITLTEQLNVMGFGNTGISDYRRTVADGMLAALQLRNTEMQVNTKSLSSALDYRHKFSRPQQELTANLTYALSSSARAQEYITRYYDGDEQLLLGPVHQRNPGDGSTGSLNGQVDLTTPFLSKNGKLESGVKMQLYSFATHTTPSVAIPGMPEAVDSTLLSSFDYTQDIYAAYASFSDRIGRISWQAGLRGEYAAYKGSTEALGGQTFSNDFLNLFPSAYLSYQLTKEQSAYLSYTRRVNRPGFMQLMPYVDLSNPQDTSIGNPGLIPEFINNTELSYNRRFEKGHTFLVSVYYQHTQNLIERYRHFYDDGTTFSQQRNLKSGSTYGLELTGKVQLLPIWDATTNFNFFRNRINGTNVDGILNNEGFSWFGKINTNIRLPQQFSLQFNGNYEAPKVAAQSTMQEIWWMDVALRKNILNNRGTLVFNVSDVFNTRKYTTLYDLPLYRQSGYRDRETRIANISFTWRIGNADSKSGWGSKRRGNGLEQQPMKDRDNIRLKEDEGGF